MDFSNQSVVSIGGKHYIESQLPQDAQKLIEIHRVWADKLQQQRIDLSMTEAAIRQLNTELAQLMYNYEHPAQPETEAAAPQESAETDGGDY